MSQVVPTRSRKIPNLILDDISSKFLINLVSCSHFFQLCCRKSRKNIFCFCVSHPLLLCRFFIEHFSIVFTFSLRRSRVTKSVSSSKLSSRTGSSSTFSAHKRKMRFTRAASSSSRARSSSTFHFSTIIFPISTILSKNGDSTRCRCRPTVQFCSRPT